MAGGLVGLLDDIAALAKLAAASVDDVAAAAAKASAKAAGVVIDDAAVTPTYVQGLAAKRELPIIKRIAVGSLKNKLLFILPAVLLLSEFVPILIEIILMFGGAFLCYEGAHKIHGKFFHKGDAHGEGAATKAALPTVVLGPEAEEKTIQGAIRTDFILSGEIMVISLKEVIADAGGGLEEVAQSGFISRAAIMVVVAILITVVVYGAVGLIVKMDDIGLAMVERGGSSADFGRKLVTGMPKLLQALTVIGTAAMLWVGGHIILVGTHELGWDGLYDPVHSIEESVADVALGGLWGWLINTGISAILGLIIGGILVTVIGWLPFGKDQAAAH